MSTSPEPPAVVQGFRYLTRAAALLAGERRLRRYLVVPMVMTLVVAALAYLTMLAIATALVNWLVLFLPLWLNPIGLLLNAVLMVVLLWVTGIGIAKFGVILGSPWYGQLAEEIERMHLPAGEVPEAPEGLAQMTVDIGRAVLYEGKKLALVLGIGVPALLLNLVPVVGSAAAGAVWGGLGVTTLVLDFLDPALERRRLRFREKLGLVVAHAPASTGFGLPALFLAGIPLVNLITVPLCMAAGTLFYIDRLHPRLAAAGRSNARALNDGATEPA